MKVRDAVGQILGELAAVLERVDEGPVERLLDALAAARRIYVAGEGRSGLVARTFAMRLVHLGMTAYACGETITPAIGPSDLCLACSGSGATPITCHRARQSVAAGARVAAVVAVPGTSLGSEADIEIVLPAPTKVSRETSSRQFGATLFEQSLLVFLDAVVLLLQERQGASPETMRAHHANLE